MRAVLVGCAAAIVLIAALVVAGAVFFAGRSGGGPGSPLTADPAVQALVSPRLSVVETLASSVVASCPAHRSGTAPSPAIGTPIVSWPETRGVSVECMFESTPGSGSATGGGFEVYGDTSIPDGGWAEYGASGWHLDACRSPGSADCTDYAYSTTDPRYVQIESWRRFPTGDGWVHVQVVLVR